MSLKVEDILENWSWDWKLNELVWFRLIRVLFIRHVLKFKLQLGQLAMVEPKFTQCQADTRKSDKRTNEILVRRKISEKRNLRAVSIGRPEWLWPNLRKVPTFDVSLSNKGKSTPLFAGRRPWSHQVQTKLEIIEARRKDFGTESVHWAISLWGQPEGETLIAGPAESSITICRAKSGMSDGSMHVD